MDNFLLAGHDLVVGDKAALDIDGFFVALGQVAHVSHRCAHDKVSFGVYLLEILLYSLRLCGRLNDDELHWHKNSIYTRWRAPAQGRGSIKQLRVRTVFTIRPTFAPPLAWRLVGDTCVEGAIRKLVDRFAAAKMECGINTEHS